MEEKISLDNTISKALIPQFIFNSKSKTSTKPSAGKKDLRRNIRLSLNEKISDGDEKVVLAYERLDDGSYSISTYSFGPQREE